MVDTSGNEELLEEGKTGGNFKIPPKNIKNNKSNYWTNKIFLFKYIIGSIVTLGGFIFAVIFGYKAIKQDIVEDIKNQYEKRIKILECQDEVYYECNRIKWCKDKEFLIKYSECIKKNNY